MAYWKNEDTPVAKHLNTVAHSQEDMVVMVIDELQNCDACLCKTRETGKSRLWRALLHVYDPHSGQTLTLASSYSWTSVDCLALSQHD